VLAGQQLVRGMLPVLVVALAVDVLGAGDQAVGILNSAIGLGALIGGGLAIAILRWLALPAAFAGAVLVWGSSLLIPWLIPLLVPAAIALALGGAGKAILEVTGITLLQRSVPTNHRASVFGILESAVTISVAAGALLAAVLVAWLGPTGALLVAGIMPVLLIGASWPALRSADESTATSEHDIHHLRDVPMLRPLALCTTEELAASIRRVSFDAGEVVIRQGDAGDCFYIIEAGLLEAVVDERPVRTLRPGDSFGEIALLRDVPRTATVRALEPSVVVAMDRDHFLAAVTGRPEASAAAEQIIRGRLGG
jgi:MFS family permease